MLALLKSLPFVEIHISLTVVENWCEKNDIFQLNDFKQFFVNIK